LHCRSVAARLAGGGGLEIADAGEPDCYGIGLCLWLVLRRRTVAARLAGGGGFEIADAGEPDCYGDFWVCLRFGLRRRTVAARLAGGAMVRAPRRQALR